jgi:type III restriction enzyme
MSNPFFDHPILNSPYEYPMRYWELDETGQPTQKIIERRRSAKFVTPIPKPKKRKAAAQSGFVFDEGKGLSTNEQQYPAVAPAGSCTLGGISGGACSTE